MIRYCPNCRTERPLTEFFCGGEIEGAPCNWDLSGEAIHSEGWRPPRIAAGDSAAFAPLSPGLVCRNGHPMEEGDLICLECGAEAAEPFAEPSDPPHSEREIRAIGAWAILSALPAAGKSADRYSVRHETSGQEAALSLFKTGFEPDPLVYETLQKLPLAHVPQVFDWGRWENRFFTVAESIPGQTLASLLTVISDEADVRRIVRELGESLNSLTEAGIRHRDMNPDVLMVRAADPLDLVITGFGSARLSDFDLDIVAPLETNRYMAPEAIVGAVSPASDWWSLGMILIEQLTGGKIFAGIHERAFVIQALARGAPIPESLPPALQMLLKGLLTRDHAARWQWREVSAWLEGRFVEPPAEHVQRTSGAEQATAIRLGGLSYADPARFALSAAEPDHWEEAGALLRRGGLAAWLAALAAASPENEALGKIVKTLSAEGEDVGDSGPERWRGDRRLMLALKLLNPSLPLVLRGELLSPGWLLGNAREAYALVNSDIPRLLAGYMPDDANWFLRLQTREWQIRERARKLDIPLNEDALRIYSLNTSQSRLAAIWGERLKAFPETDHPGIARLLERQSLTDSDCIILLSAELSLFTPARELLDDAIHLMREHAIVSFSAAETERLAETPRGELYRALDARLADFAYSGHTALDQWAQEYRLKKRLPLAKTVAILSTAAETWTPPPRQRYIQELFVHFDKKLVAAGLHGPLARMQTGARSSCIDFAEMATERISAAELVRLVLERASRTLTLDPAIFDDPALSLTGRLGSLRSKNDLYCRDTGINGLYVGFPFLVFRANRDMRNPRVMPLLLWPVRVEGEPYGRKLKLGFDSNREEVRLNPFIEALTGAASCQRWRDAAHALLSRSNLDIQEAVGILSAAADTVEPELQRLDPLGRRVPVGQQRLIASAVLFHAAFAGQAISEELRLLMRTAAVPGALGAAFGLYEAPKASSPDSAPKRPPSYFVTHRDPSQEKAVRKSRSTEGLLIEGPPGTGKSQTIVNMVSQALGDKRTVLIVCQKRAALEVVYKRLAAERLAGRVVMLTDSRLERIAVIKDIRAQVEQYFSQTAPSPARKARERDAQLALVEKLETEVDDAHEAFYRDDPRCGHSYRDILGKLIDLRGKTAGINAPQLRKMLAPLSAPGLACLLENSAPLASPWLDARYENSPLHAFLVFTPDPANVAVLQKALEAFGEAEKKRVDQGKNAPCALSRQNDAIFAEWYASHAQGMESLDPDDLAAASRWLPLFKVPGQAVSAPTGDAMIRELEEIAERIAECPLASFSALFSPRVVELPHRRLSALRRDSAPDRLFFLQRCAPWRILGRMRLVALLKRSAAGDASPAARAQLHGAARLELAIRPLRERLRAIRLELGLQPAAEGETLRLSILVQQTLRSFAALGAKLKSLVPLPEVSLLEDALLRADRDAVARELRQFGIAADRHAHAARSLELLDDLAPWFTENALERFRSAVKSGKSMMRFLGSLLASMPHLEKFMTFKKRGAALPDEALRLFSLMRRHETALFALAPEERESVFRSIAQTEALLAWKERLEIQRPLLGIARDELEAKIARLKEADDALRELNRDMLALSVDREKLGARSRWVD
ncbi:MAG: DUF4011 domain-containing protein, partial [Azoarcus sp.]|nr:DUF4011 domain-containing protein [Azoarcus sp.]